MKMKTYILLATLVISLLTISASTLAQETNPTSNPNTENSVVKEEKKNAVKNYFDEYNSYTWRWSFAYWGSVFGAAILSALAGILLKLDALKDKQILRLSQTDISALLAGIAALLITISSAGDFSGKWKANRTAKFRTEQLKNELDNPKLTNQDVTERLNKIIEDQNNGVINTKDEVKK
jgi:hypothetical protein